MQARGMAQFMSIAHIGENKNLKQTRQHEEVRLSLQEQNDLIKRNTQYAQWEKQTVQKAYKSAVTTTAKNIEFAQQQLVEVRRQRLSELLRNEDENLRVELAAQMENSHQRAERLATIARSRKQERENQRQAYAEAAYERQWKENCDDLRTIDANFFGLHCYDTAQLQAKEKQERARRKEEEDKIWADEWERERQKKLDNEEMRLSKRRQADNETRTVLREQVDAAHKRTEEYQNELKREKEAAQAKFLAEEALEKEKALADHLRKAEANRINAAENLKIHEERSRAKFAQRTTELNELAMVAKAEADDLRARAQNKENQRNEMKAYLAYIKRSKEIEAELEAEMAKVVSEEVAKTNSKRDEQWANETMKRQQLLEDVLSTRQAQLQEHERTRQMSREGVRRERERIEKEIAGYQAYLDEEENINQRNRLNRRKDLQDQIAAIRAQRQKEEEELAAERRAAVEAERLHQEKLERHKRDCISASQKLYGIAADRQSERWFLRK